MHRHERRLATVIVSAAWFVALGHGEAIAQRTKMLEFGPDAIEAEPLRRAAGGTPRDAPAGSGTAERPWVLASASELRLPPPPDERESARERREMRKLAVGDDPAALERVRTWDADSPARRWDETFLGLRGRLDGAAASHARALFDAAVHDARIAAWDSKNAYKRPRPSQLDARLVPEVAVPRGPSYPCEHAVVAGAAAAVLAHLFPTEAAPLTAAASEAAWSRVVASAVYPSDAEAGLALGRAVAARAIERVGDNPRWVALPERREREGLGDVARSDGEEPEHWRYHEHAARHDDVQAGARALLAEHGHADRERGHGVAGRHQRRPEEVVPAVDGAEQ